MAGDGKSTLQTIIENTRDAGVAFGRRFAPPADNIRRELGKLLGELGIADPQRSVTDALEATATAWRDLADALSGVSLNVVDPAKTASELTAKAKTIEDAIGKMVRAPQDAVAGLGASAVAIKTVFAERLLNYIVYEFIISTHPKIGGAFLLLGVLRREFRAAGGNAAFVDAEIRVFDLAQFVRALTSPRESFLTVMRWGTNDFLARPVVDGLALLLGTVPGAARGPADDELPLAEEVTFVQVDAGVRKSARRTVTLPPGVTIAFVGLHKHGVGLVAPNPVSVGGNLIPPLPPNAVFAVTPGANPATSDPAVDILP